MLLHLVFRELKQGTDFKKEYKEIDNSIIESMVSKYIEILVQVKNKLYPDAYPANIYKNVGRCRKIMNDIEEIEKDE